MAEFYVYQHRRNDTGLPFYVGKGKGRRAYVKQHKTEYWRAIVAKAGHSVEIVVAGLDEELAHLAEMELIAKYKATGVRLCNMTDGGEGMSGFKWEGEAALKRASALKGIKRPDISARLKGVAKSAEHRAKLSASKMGFTHTDETRRKMSESRKGRQGPMLGKKHRPETIEKIRAAGMGEKNPFFGKTHTPETIAVIMAKNIGRKDSDETRARKSAAHRGEKAYNFGKPRTPEQKAMQSATLKQTIAASKMECPHCGKKAVPCNARRWHFDNCKGKK